MVNGEKKLMENENENEGKSCVRYSDCRYI